MEGEGIFEQLTHKKPNYHRRRYVCLTQRNYIIDSRKSKINIFKKKELDHPINLALYFRQDKRKDNINYKNLSLHRRRNGI